MRIGLKSGTVFVGVLCLGLGMFTPSFSSENDTNDIEISKKAPEQQIKPPEPIVVRVTGYGAYQNSMDAESEPKRLLALRASKLDAFRTLAERVYGTTVSGTSTVRDFVLKSDGFGTVVDTVVRGARVVSITEKKGAGFETVLEVLLPGDFNNCLTKTNSFRNGIDCLRPVPQFNAFRSGNTGNSKAPNNMSTLYYLQ